MKFLKDRTFWLMFVFFFLTVFFHGCSTTSDYYEFGPPEEYAVGFPFAYLDLGTSLSFQEAGFIWWALFINIILFTIIYTYNNMFMEHLPFKIYTYALMGLHIMFGISFIMLELINLNKMRIEGTPIHLQNLIYFLMLIISIFILTMTLIKTTKQKEKNDERKKQLLMRTIYLLLGLTLLLVSISYFSPWIYFMYLGSFGGFGERITDYVPIFGSGVSAFLALWLPFLILTIILRKKQKTPLKKKSSEQT